jgi:branched-chain amino acid transport system substrate-binding protein
MAPFENMPSSKFMKVTVTHSPERVYRFVLADCGDELTRENLLKQATTLKGLAPPMFIDGIGVYNSPTDYRAIHHLQLTRFDGTTLAPIGKPILLDDIS